jgi:hypothetical protein
MRSERVGPDWIRAQGSQRLIGGVLLAPVRWGSLVLPKGTRIDADTARDLGRATVPATAILRLGWPDPGELHEDGAARRLAAAVAGPGLVARPPAQSRIDLVARTDGVVRVHIAGLSAVNRIDPLEVFTLFHGQAVRAGQVVAGVKVAPHLVAEVAVIEGESVAGALAPLIDVDPYQSLAVAAIAAELLNPEGFARFDRAARTKVESLGSRFLGTTLVDASDSAVAATGLADTLRELVGRKGVALILVGGVSAGDPLSPFYEALSAVGGTLLRRGVPAHPGSMIWLASLGGTTLLGLPQCGMFSMATAADLVLPRLLTGERVTPDTLADLGHGGLLGREMRFRFPDYAQGLEAPE